MEPGYTPEELDSMLEESWLEFVPDDSDRLRLHMESVVAWGEKDLRTDFSLTEMVHGLIDMIEYEEDADQLTALASRFEGLARQLRQVASDMGG